MPVHHVAKAVHWLLQQAGIAVFGVMKQRLLDNMGLNSRTITAPNTPVLVDEYLHRFEERLAQRIIDRLDEDRLVKLNSAITQLKTAAKMATQTPLKQGHLLNAVGNFFDIANLPEYGITAGFPNAQLRYLASLGIATVYLEMKEPLEEDIAKHIVTAIYADPDTAKLWFGDQVVARLLTICPQCGFENDLTATVCIRDGYALLVAPTATFPQSTSIVKQIQKPLAVEKLRLLRTLTASQTGTSSVPSVAISSDGQTLVSGNADSTIKVWDLSTGKEMRTLRGHRDGVWSVAISANGRILVSGSFDHTIKVWDLSTGKEMRTLTGHTNRVTSVAISADGQTIISGGYDHMIKVWDLSTGKEMRTLTGHTSSTPGIWSVAISADGQTIVSGNNDKTINVWNLPTAQKTYILTSHTSSVTSVAISTDGQTLISGSYDCTIKVWNLSIGKEVRTLRGHRDAVTSGAISPDGQILISGSRDKTIKVWNLSTGREMRTLTGPTDVVMTVAISADGQTLVSGGQHGEQIKVWGI